MSSASAPWNQKWHLGSKDVVQKGHIPSLHGWKAEPLMSDSTSYSEASSCLKIPAQFSSNSGSLPSFFPNLELRQRVPSSESLSSQTLWPLGCFWEPQHHALGFQAQVSRASEMLEQGALDIQSSGMLEKEALDRLQASAFKLSICTKASYQ